MIDRYNQDKLFDEIQNEVHRHLGIFNSKIYNTWHHNYQIETKLNNFEELLSKKVEHLITNKSYQIYEDLSKQLNNIWQNGPRFQECYNTRYSDNRTSVRSVETCNNKKSRHCMGKTSFIKSNLCNIYFL